jgi:CO/xanthine dehydrogenase Mo-binding subunit
MVADQEERPFAPGEAASAPNFSGCDQSDISDQRLCPGIFAHTLACRPSTLGNRSCLALKLIAENRKDAFEDGVRGEAFDELDSDKIPPCLRSSAGFMSGRQHQLPEREIGIFDVARAAETREDLPPPLRGPLAGISDQMLPVASFPYGAQICEVEVDRETGLVEIVGYAAVDDVGRAINPLILHGQTHGGIAQGVGQALLEDCHYDAATGQLLAASFMDYAMPRADTLPTLATALSEVPSPTNRLGVRSGGEGGTTPALGVVINAIVDALSEFGVRHIDMPATPERVWRAIRSARQADH